MNEEILGGLRNALERGHSLEQAMRTFINAGYKSTEVQEAAMMLKNGTMTSLISDPIKAPQIVTQPVQNPQARYSQDQYTEVKTNQSPVRPSQPQSPVRPSQPQSPVRPSQPQSPVRPTQFQSPMPIQNNIIEARPIPSMRLNPPLTPSTTPTRSSNKIMIIVLVILLLAFIGGLVALLTFKENLVDLVMTSYG